jgi:hypothetical protein
MGQRGCIMFSLDSLKTMLKPQRVSGNTSKFNNFLAIHLLITTVLEQRIQIKFTSKVLEGRSLVVVLKFRSVVSYRNVWVDQL